MRNKSEYLTSLGFCLVTLALFTLALGQLLQQRQIKQLQDASPDIRWIVRTNDPPNYIEQDVLNEISETITNARVRLIWPGNGTNITVTIVTNAMQ